MKVLSIDVGIKNLAYCLFQRDEENPNSSFTISQWDIINLSVEKTMTCSSSSSSSSLSAKTKLKTAVGGLCGRPAKFMKSSNCYCLQHAKKQSTYLLPLAELKPAFIKKQKIAKLHEIASKYKLLAPDTSCKKADIIELISTFVSNNCLEEVKGVNASKVDLLEIGTNIKTKFNSLFEEEGFIDYVVIENQISPIANRMKTIQGMIAQYFIMSKNGVGSIQFVSASNKLKDCDIAAKKTYADRKKLGISLCLDIISINPHYQDKVEYFKSHKKKDDLSDSFLQGVWFINASIIHT
jgi:hypothetical protein